MKLSNATLALAQRAATEQGLSVDAAIRRALERDAKHRAFFEPKALASHRVVVQRRTLAAAIRFMNGELSSGQLIHALRPRTSRLAP